MLTILGNKQFGRHWNKFKGRIAAEDFAVTLTEELVTRTNIVEETKANRLRWLSHLERKREDRNVNRAYLSQRWLTGTSSQ